MSLTREIPALIRKEILLELRNRSALNGLLLYAISTVFVCFMGFALKKVNDPTWNTLLWIILLFTSVNAVAKSFQQERSGRLLYYYTLFSPQGLVLAKIIYNTLLMVVLSMLTFGFYVFVMGNPVKDPLLYFAIIVIGAASLANSLTVVSAIASKAGNNATLMAVLSFPLVIPTLAVLIRISKNAMDGLDRNLSYDELLILLSINLMSAALSYLLFPFIWKS